MTDLGEQAMVFDAVSELYDRYRPGYPEQLFDDLFELSHVIPASARVLEVGCGTGKATLPLAKRGGTILALDPGANLLAVARRNLAQFPNVSFLRSRFEDYLAAAGDEHDLVISAQAFHWIDPAVRFRLVRDALRAGGSIALFWNVPFGGETPTHHAVKDVYRKLAPGLFDAWWSKTETGPRVEDTIDESGHFKTVRMCRYLWTNRISAADYAPLLETQSDHRMLPEEQRRTLLQEVTLAIERTGGVMESSATTRLFVAERR